MAGIGTVLDLWRKNPTFSGQIRHSSRLLPATLAASTAAATFAACPFSARPFFWNGGKSVAYCDAGMALPEDIISGIKSASGNIFQHETLRYSTKEYNIELRPLFSAFQWKFLASASLRTFLIFYLPLFQPCANMEEDDEDFLQDPPEAEVVDLVVPFKKAVNQIVRESTVATTRRILERLAVRYGSQRTAWKLLKDVPKSAMRKSVRGMPTTVYIFGVSRTTLRAASWLVTVGTEVYRFLSTIFYNKEEANAIDKAEQIQTLGKKVCALTVRCGASLVFASIGAGLGAVILRPSCGQRIGCEIGGFAGPVIVACCLRLDL